MASNQTTATPPYTLDVFALELPNEILPSFDYQTDDSIPNLLNRKDSPISPSTSSPGSVGKINREFVFPSGHHLSHEFLTDEFQSTTDGHHTYSEPYSPNGPTTPTPFFSPYNQFLDQFPQPTSQFQTEDNPEPQRQYLPLPYHQTKHHQYQSFNHMNHSADPNYNQHQIRQQPKQRKQAPALDLGGPILPCPEPGCLKTFNRPFNLKSHLKSHATERLFACDSCPASFRRSHDLKRHCRSLHTSIKPFDCSYCSKKFARMDALKRHASRVGSNCYQPAFIGPGARNGELFEQGAF